MTGRLGRLRPLSGFGKTLAGSVILHAALIALAALLYASGGGRVFITPVYTVDLVSRGPLPAPQAPPAEPVKEAAPQPEPPKPEPKEQKAPEGKAPAETVKVKEKPSVDAALKKIEKKVEQRKDQALVASSIDDLKKKIEAERKSRDERVSKLREEITSRSASEKTAPPAAKPQAAAANPAGGAPRANLESKYPAYYGLLRDKVQENWIYPEGLKDASVSVIVSIKIARTGALLDVAVEKSSGDQAFDSSLLKAVKKAAPFPPLPVDMEGSFLETGLRFCPGCAQ